MNYTKPIIFFDLETTGVNVETDRIVQIALMIVKPDGTKEFKSRYINPEIPIPKEASDVHHITDETVKDAPIFKRVAKGLFQIFEGCNVAGYNSDAFDIPLLHKEFERCGIEWDVSKVQRVDVFKLYKLMHPNDLSSVYHRLTGNILTNAHNAEDDINATFEVFNKLVELSDGMFESVEDVTEYTQDGKLLFDLAGKMYIDEDGIVRWSYTKHKDKPILDDRGYLDWFMKQDSTPSETKKRVLDYIVNKKSA
jgi:DNA polymerase-3 subunit epsilon